MQGKTPKKAMMMNESMLDFSIPKEKLTPIHSHKRTPSLRLKESLASSTLFQEPIITSRKDLMVSWGLPKTPQRGPIELSDLQVSNLVSKIPNTTKHSRSNSTLQQANLTAKEAFFASPKAKKQSVEVQSTPKRSQGKMAALKELYQVPTLTQKKAPHVNISRNSCSLIPTEFMSPKNERDQKESIDNLLGSLKGVVFSDTKNRLSKYQRRFLELNGDLSKPVIETISTPKPLSKRGEDGTPKAHAKNVNSSKQSQMLAQALSQCLSLKSPSRGPSRAGTPCQITPRDEKEIIVEKEKIFPSSVKHHKRGMSWGQMPMFIEGPIIMDRGSAKVTKEDFAQQQEREQMRAQEDELEQFNKFLCIDMQTFDFEKAMIMRREAKKNKMNSVAVVSGGNGGEVDMRDRDTMLRSMFAYYSKESEKPAQTGESSKNQGGSTTANSSKLASEVLEMKKDRKKKSKDDERDLEQFLEMLENNQKSTKRRSYKQEEF